MSYILEVIKNFLLYAPAALICISFHEASHGLVAYWLGDNTAKNRGRLTVNPLAHIDIMGLVCMIVFHFGWARPVPVDPRNFKRPKVGMALTALVLFCWQGSIYLLALLLGSFMTPDMMTELSIVGGFLIFGSGLSILGIKDCKTMNMLPALIIPVLFCAITGYVL
jgi:Zn-dependent protease